MVFFGKNQIPYLENRLMSDEQFQDFHPSQCVILQHQREEGGHGLAP